jgi:hypothetical protein
MYVSLLLHSQANVEPVEELSPSKHVANNNFDPKVWGLNAQVDMVP